MMFRTGRYCSLRATFPYGWSLLCRQREANASGVDRSAKQLLSLPAAHEAEIQNMWRSGEDNLRDVTL
jgi:hypothetical protein